MGFAPFAPYMYIAPVSQAAGEGQARGVRASGREEGHREPKGPSDTRHDTHAQRTTTTTFAEDRGARAVGGKTGGGTRP